MELGTSCNSKGIHIEIATEEINQAAPATVDRFSASPVPRTPRITYDLSAARVGLPYIVKRRKQDLGEAEKEGDKTEIIK